MKIEQTQYPFQENSNAKISGLLITFLTSLAFISICIFLNQKLKKTENENIS